MRLGAEQQESRQQAGCLPFGWNDFSRSWRPVRLRLGRSVLLCHRLRNPRSAGTDGFVLLIVLVVVMLASMVAASLLFMLNAEQVAAAAGERGEQAWTTALSGVYQGLRVAAETTPGALDWQDNPTLFQQQLVSDEGVQRWYFSIYSVSEGGGVRYGLTDEASKLNVYLATPTMLESLPNLSPPLVENLLAALASSAAAVPSERESNSTAATRFPVSGRSHWTCLDELLNVNGFNPAMLYGDYGRFSGRLDAQSDLTSTSTGRGALTAPPLVENSPSNRDNFFNPSASPDLGEEPVGPGLSRFLTVCSSDLNLDSQGQPRVNLNQPDANLANLNLPASALAYLKALQRNGRSLAHPAELLEARAKFKNEKGQEVELRSEIGKAELALLLDRCTTTNQSRLVGLINLNTAPVEVLAALPGLNALVAESIISARAGLSPEARKTPAWLFEQGLVSAETFKQLAPYLTTRSYQFHFFVAAYAIPAGNYRVLEVVADAAVQPPAVLLLRDVSRLGLPFVPGAGNQEGAFGAAAGGTSGRRSVPSVAALPNSPRRPGGKLPSGLAGETPAATGEKGVRL